MNLARRIVPALLLAVLVFPTTATAQDNGAYLSALGADFDGASEKLTSLAGAIPAELYDWRPSEGVRSVSESLVHTAMANYFFASRLGLDMPEGLPEDPEQNVTEKDAVMELLTASQAHVRTMLEGLADADLSTTMQVFGQEMNQYGMLAILAGHSHEHLGQLIAYARSNEIAPPWSGG